MAAFPKLPETYLLLKLRSVLILQRALSRLNIKPERETAAKLFIRRQKNIELTRVYEHLLKNRFGIFQALGLTFYLRLMSPMSGNGFM
ncbi:hypothetical protein BBC0178_009990 [Bartonella apihabitans]|uniref:Uncharacterized protein n=1 Tax=Bartonella apihabitans TaxID=2750929 RepID=A0A1U9MB04_9HYPH|nr:hypothetical protein BBC0178_009990 [Bartonella apihabitans]